MSFANDSRGSHLFSVVKNGNKTWDRGEKRPYRSSANVRQGLEGRTAQKGQDQIFVYKWTGPICRESNYQQEGRLLSFSMESP